jgi:hypothetical protein
MGAALVGIDYRDTKKIETGKSIPVAVVVAVAAESSWWGASIVLGAESAAIMPRLLIRF